MVVSLSEPTSDAARAKLENMGVMGTLRAAQRRSKYQIVDE
jgi:hypothetical protein